MDKKSVFIISTIPVAEGQGASYARILSYAKALANDKNISVYMLSTVYPLALDENMTEISADIFLCGDQNTSDEQTSFTKRTSGKVFGKKTFSDFLENVSHFISEIDGEKAVLVYPTINNYANEKALLEMLKSKGIAVFSERNELNIGKVLNSPFPKNPVKKLFFGVYYPFKLFDHYQQDRLVADYEGNIVISTTMEKRVTGLNPNLIRIPILTDVTSFDHRSARTKPNSEIVNIGFTGTINNKKDGITELIEAISILEHKYRIKNLKLNLYGPGYRDVIAGLNKKITKLGLNDRVIMHGKVSSSEIPEIMLQQDILVLTRPVSLQTRYGFSTKLAEYMASGVTVLATDVSDNALYISDGENGFIAKSHKPEDTAEKLNEIIASKKYLNATIRQKAIETAKKHFDGNNYASILKNFFFPTSN